MYVSSTIDIWLLLVHSVFYSINKPVTFVLSQPQVLSYGRCQAHGCTWVEVPRLLAKVDLYLCYCLTLQPSGLKIHTVSNAAWNQPSQLISCFSQVLECRGRGNVNHWECLRFWPVWNYLDKIVPQLGSLFTYKMHYFLIISPWVTHLRLNFQLLT